MTIVIVPARVYHGLLERWTTPTDRLIYRDRGVALPDGRVRFELDAAALELIEPFRLEGETYPEFLERLVALGETEGRLQ
ncbi:hypothetical protein JJC00_18960 [Bradyrhizobium diazoefficiens]|uniref:DUF7557 family protein n=1 Tax=Bradyrhizobium diazoefficiens TaxID=1355477 RepID=UPI00190B2321|nr:hypothetical protein [Bradyrhizobium diazoefficiens]QQO30766.1 hypothetical protein JJC00_18960 [Bradyrhizobium diazoefficiens]